MKLGTCPYCGADVVSKKMIAKGKQIKLYHCINAKKEYDESEQYVFTADSTCTFMVYSNAFLRWNKRSFSEYEMKGVPVRIEIGKRDLALNMVTIATRYNREKQQILKDEVVQMMPSLIQTIHLNMYDKAQRYVKENTYYVSNYDDFKDKIKSGGYVAMSVHQEAEAIIKADTQATARVIPFDQTQLESKCPVTGKQASQVIMFARAY